ncbi:jg27596 [Pararge aegeria aegeria]|uniref:Jg27596 protein n=1 Tax=Pararge aegeria aegeria TaxID=348720 RepID=A0A8S4R362_9NEOP|nr:jg27596 [Pararge aegeria aegeria]
MSIHIKDSDDLKTRLAEAGEKLVVIDFMATWCGPCKMIGPKLDELATELAESVVVLKEKTRNFPGVHLLNLSS